MKNIQNIRTRALVGATLVSMAIAIPFLPTMVQNVQHEITAGLTLTKASLQKTMIKKYKLVTPNASTQSSAGIGTTTFTIRRFVPISTTHFFPAASSQSSSAPQQTITTTTSSQSVRYITLPSIPSFIQYLFSPSSRSSTPNVSTSSRPIPTSSSSRISTYTSVAPTTSSSRMSTYTSTTPTTSSSRFSTYTSTVPTTSSSRTSIYYSSIGTNYSSTYSVFSYMSLHNAANSSSSSLCMAVQSANGMCCDAGDNDKDGISNDDESECNEINITSCGTNPRGDEDGDGIHNEDDQDCA